MLLTVIFQTFNGQFRNITVTFVKYIGPIQYDFVAWKTAVESFIAYEGQYQKSSPHFPNMEYHLLMRGTVLTRRQSKRDVLTLQ